MKRIHTNEYKNPSKIIGIQFSMLSPEEIKKNSVVEIVSRETIVNNKLAVGGLFDAKMGVLEQGLFCPTDGLTYIDTPGYFGHMEMARPVFFIQHIKEIIKISKCICYKCSKLLVNKQKYKHVMELSPEDRWSFVTDMSFKRCGEDTDDGCGCKQPDKIKQEGFATLFAIWENLKSADTGEKKTITQKLTPERVLKMFKRISDEDVQFMGFSSIWSRPEWMICKILPVPPPAVRPSVKHDAQQRSEDDLTHIYMNILKTNNFLKEKIAANATPMVIDKYHQILQYFVAMIANNKASGTSPIAQTSGRPYQCISGRLNTKNGRIRGNLMGKRVDFSARSVITGDPNLSIRQLGVPLKIAKNITKPITVNNRNRNFLLKLVQNGPDEYPGAKILEKKNGDNVSLRYVDRMSIKLENGDKVHRHMMDGDYVLFNRQPSLHKMSMMCHEVKVMKKGDTFRFNVGVTNPYNADFDGDEMNMHMPQSGPAETELMFLPAVPYQIISPSKNAPIIGIFQDSLLGCFRFTRDTVEMDAREAMNLLMMFPDVDVQKIREKQNKITSFDVLSQITPPMTFKQKTKLFDASEDTVLSNQIVEIKNGVYHRGQIEKSMLGSSTKGILHRICNDFGNMTCVKYIDNLQNVITEYMKTSSFSVGISDLIANKTTKQKILQIVANKKQEVQDLMNQVHLGLFENTSAYSNVVDFETKINNILNKATEEAGKIGRSSLDKNNRFLMIVNSGSKGSILNISQMISCLGQQSVEGKRVPYGFEHRTLPHFSKYDDSTGARGFVENSYITGLTAHEMFFHAMAGRIGLIDTAVKTSQTGYAQRRIVKSLEDIVVLYDMTVRNHMGKIVQFQYGEDGFDSTKVENQHIPLVTMSVEDIYMHYDIIGLQETDKSQTQLLRVFSKGTVTRIKKQLEETRTKCRTTINTMLDKRTRIVEKVFRFKNDSIVKIPVSFPHLIGNIQGQLQLGIDVMVDITPLEAFQMIEENYQKIIKFMGYMKTNELFETLYYFYLSPKDLLVNKRFHRKALTLLLETIFLKYKQAIVHPGEMVGVIAAQSVGEPTTQLTLNTFHNVGVASKSNVTRGVPRIEEILRLTKYPKNPSLTVFLKPLDEQDQDRAMNYSNMIEHTRLQDIVRAVQIYFDPNDHDTVIEEDRRMLEQYYEYEKIVEPYVENDATRIKSKWIIRMEMNIDTMLDKNITMDDVHFAISSVYSDKVSCIYSDYNDSKLIFRIRMVKEKSKSKKNTDMTAEPLDTKDEICTLKNFQDNLLRKIVLRGVDGIFKVIPRKLQNMVVKDDGKYVRKDTWILDTTGTNYLEVLGLPFIDYVRTYSNDINEVFNTLGIEAARQVILNELTEVMEYSDVYINYHHLSVLCDRMTYSKGMVAVYRSGILNDNIGPVAKSTFEMHTEMLLNAARHGHLDNMRGVSANVMCGQHGYFGTNAFQLHLNLKEMEKNTTASVMVKQSQTQNLNEEIEKQFGISTADTRNNQCTMDKILIQNQIVQMNQNEQTRECQNDNYDMGF